LKPKKVVRFADFMGMDDEEGGGNQAQYGDGEEERPYYTLGPGYTGYHDQ